VCGSSARTRSAIPSVEVQSLLEGLARSRKLSAVVGKPDHVTLLPHPSGGPTGVLRRLGPGRHTGHRA
jgi:hypothetical protein